MSEPQTTPTANRESTRIAASPTENEIKTSLRQLRSDVVGGRGDPMIRMRRCRFLPIVFATLFHGLCVLVATAALFERASSEEVRSPNAAAANGNGQPQLAERAPGQRGEFPSPAAPAVSPTSANIFLAPFPKERWQTRHYRPIRESLVEGEISLVDGESRKYKFSVPARFSRNSTFVSVTGSLKTVALTTDSIHLTDGLEIASAAPHFASDEWQTFTVVFPYPLTTNDFTLEIAPSGTMHLRDVWALVVEDTRYLRDVCSEVYETGPGGGRRHYYELHEELAYEKQPERKRVLLVGNSTIDGCGSSKGATLSYILQQKLEALHPDRFEVINGGIGAANYVSHIVSITNHYPLLFDRWPDVNDMKRHLHQFPAVKDLGADYLILAVHWNDTREYRGWLTREPPAPDSDVHQNTRMSLVTDRALEAVFHYIDDSSKENLVKMNESRRDLLARKASDTSIWNGLAREHFRFLTVSYIERLKKYSPDTRVILMTLPNLDHPQGVPTKEVPAQEPAMQREVYREVAASFSLPLIDHSQVFLDKIRSDKKLTRYARSEMMSDLVHFRYLGNQWLADQMYPQLIEYMSNGGVGR